MTNVRSRRLMGIMSAARQKCRSSATSAPIQDAPVRPWTTRATRELVRWPRTSAVPAGTGLPQRSPRRASCAVFGNVFNPASTSSFTGTDTAIDLYIENITYYYNWDPWFGSGTRAPVAASTRGGTHHLQNKLVGEFAQINLDGPGSEYSNRDPYLRLLNPPPHETTFKFRFVRRDTGQPVSIPWMQFTFFDFDENVLTDWLVNKAGAKEGDGREARSLH